MEIDFKIPSEAELRAIDIHELLPQQEPFVMVGCLVHFDEKLTITETTIRKENIFVERGHLSATGLVENIAQTCAARIGFINKMILKTEVRIGYIGAIRDLAVIKRPAVGETITTQMEVMEEIFGMILAKVDVLCHGETLVHTEMKIAVEKEENL